jgi:hypothetical protein
MVTRTPTRKSGGSDAPPPTQAPPAKTDEGPMRRELLRQIAVLDADLAARTPLSGQARVTAPRGPALQTTEQLERIRDELLRAPRRP